MSDVSYILAIDPGPVESGWVLLRDDGLVRDYGVLSNAELRGWFPGYVGRTTTLVIEMVASYGMPVGADIFETCVQIGSFEQAWPCNKARVFRRDVKLHLCNNVRAKDSNIWQALVDRYGPGKAKAVGTKKAQGPLYGVTKHARAALAVGVTYLDQLKTPRPA